MFVGNGHRHSSGSVGVPAVTLAAGSVSDTASILDENEVSSGLGANTTEKIHQEMEDFQNEFERAVQISIRAAVDLNVLMERAEYQSSTDRVRRSIPVIFN